MDTFWIIISLINHLLSSFLSILLLCCPQLMGGRHSNNLREINSEASSHQTELVFPFISIQLQIKTMAVSE